MLEEVSSSSSPSSSRFRFLPRPGAAAPLRPLPPLEPRPRPRAPLPDPLPRRGSSLVQICRELSAFSAVRYSAFEMTFWQPLEGFSRRRAASSSAFVSCSSASYRSSLSSRWVMCSSTGVGRSSSYRRQELAKSGWCDPHIGAGRCCEQDRTLGTQRFRGWRGCLEGEGGASQVRRDGHASGSV